MKLEEIEKFCEEATPGPWEWSYYCLHNGRLRIPILHRNKNSKWPISKNNLEFIAASRTLMPQLLKVAKAADVCLKSKIHFDSAYDNLLQYALDELENE